MTKFVPLCTCLAVFVYYRLCNLVGNDDVSARDTPMFDSDPTAMTAAVDDCLVSWPPRRAATDVAGAGEFSTDSPTTRTQSRFDTRTTQTTGVASRLNFGAAVVDSTKFEGENDVAWSPIEDWESRDVERDGGSDASPENLDSLRGNVRYDRDNYPDNTRANERPQSVVSTSSVGTQSTKLGCENDATSSPTEDWESRDVKRDEGSDASPECLDSLRRNVRYNTDYYPGNNKASERPQSAMSMSSIDTLSTKLGCENDVVTSPIEHWEVDHAEPPDVKDLVSSMIQSKSVESFRGSVGSQSLTTSSRRPGRKVSSVDDGSARPEAMSSRCFRQNIPVQRDRFEKPESEIDLWYDDNTDSNDLENVELESLTTSRRPGRKVSSVDDGLPRPEAMSSRCSRQNVPVQRDILEKSRSKTDLWLDGSTVSDVLENVELEDKVTVSDDLDNDDEEDVSVGTAPIVAQRRQLSTVVDQKPPHTSSASAQLPEQRPQQKRTRPVDKSQKVVSNLSSRVPRSVAGHTARGRTYDQPTISAAAKQVQPTFTWNRPSPSEDSGSRKPADRADRPLTAGSSRNKLQLDERFSVDRSVDSDDVGMPTVRGNSNVGTSDSQVKGSSKSTSRRHLGTAAKKSRSVSEPKDTLSDMGDTAECSEPTQPHNFSDELSNLAARLQDPDSDAAAIRSSSSRHHRGHAGRRRGNVGSGAGQQAVEDVYVEAMLLDAEGRVSRLGQSSIEWRRELARIIDSLRHQLRSRNGTRSDSSRLSLINNDDFEDFANYIRQKANGRKIYRRSNFTKR